MAIEDYNDIIHLPYNGRKEGKGERLSMYQRAAQFAPFAALTGHDAAIRETARLTDCQIELGDETVAILNRKMSIVREHLKEQPEITITYFLPDEKKTGGMYRTHTGRIKSIDDYENVIIMTDKTKIPVASILDIDSELTQDALDDM